MSLVLHPKSKAIGNGRRESIMVFGARAMILSNMEKKLGWFSKYQKDLGL
jgi:hypothetical protein